MKWFAHEVDASENKKIRRIEAWGQKLHPEYGAIYATGLYFRLLEVISRHGEMFRLPDDYGLDLVANDLRTTEEVLERFLDFLAQINGIDPLAWGKKIIFCPKLAERVDRYTDEMIKATISGLTDKITISYELLSIVRVLAKHPDPRKRTHYSQALHRLCTEHPHPLEPDFSPGESGSKHFILPSECPKDIGANYQELPENNPAQTLHSSCTPSAPGREGKGREGKGIGKLEAKASGGSAAPPPQAQITPAKVFHLWNDLECKPALAELTPERNKRLAVRIRKRGDPAWWEQLFLKAKTANKPWLTFDFLIANDTNAMKVLEGNYDRDFGSAGGGRKTGAGAYQKPDPANPGKFASFSRTFKTDPGGSGTSPEANAPGEGDLPGAPGSPVV
jgi:hypothetical protein